MLFHCAGLRKVRESKAAAILILSEIRIEARALDRFLSSRATSVYS